MFSFMVNAFYVMVGVVCFTFAAVVVLSAGVAIYRLIKKKSDKTPPPFVR